MSAWLVRAIVVENVLARHHMEMLFLPAGPDFRLAKEIKNVITVIAKACHYWVDHMPLSKRQSIELMIMNSRTDQELLEPASPADIHNDSDVYWNVAAGITRTIAFRLELACVPNRYPGWVGVECPNVSAAIWLMRTMIVENILARREEKVLFLPAHPRFATHGRLERLVDAFTSAYRLHATKAGKQ
jgi:hypothetical protein